MIQVQRAYEINSKQYRRPIRCCERTDLQLGPPVGSRHRLPDFEDEGNAKYALHACSYGLMVATLTGCARIPAKPLVQGRPRRGKLRPGTGGEWLHISVCAAD